MILLKRINNARKIALCLFILSFLSLTGSLWLHNTLINFKFSKNEILDDGKLKNIPGFIFRYKTNCSENIDTCVDGFFKQIKLSDSLNNCFSRNIKYHFMTDDKIIKENALLFTIDESKAIRLIPEYSNKDIELIIEVTDKNERCIKNSKFYDFYKIFPYFHDFVFNLKNSQKTNLGSSEKINPFIYGESSISNIVKRYPINYVFKPLLFISVIFMYLYWRNYKFLFSNILRSEKDIFITFGVMSAIFLFLHVFFLGIEVDNKIFKLLKKLFIGFFILFEILAQFLLTIKLYKNKNNLINFCNLNIINIKIFYVAIISLISIVVIAMLLIYNLSSKVDYILEWNYFAALLFYYLMSFLMWKKIN